MTQPDDATTGQAALPASPASDLRARRYRAVRQASQTLTRSLTAEDQLAQSMPDASPTKWHLAHTSWFFETFLLTPRLAGYRPFDPRFGYLFNSYYETIGERQPRPQRGLLTRPSLDDVLAYRAHVDAGMERLLAAADAEVDTLLDLGLAHEEQHQELILMDVLHLFASSPLKPAYAPPRGRSEMSQPKALEYVDFAGGLVEIGHPGQGFAFDNEGPRHRVWLHPFRLADRLVTNAEWQAFMDDGGYRRPELWLSDGWALVQAEGWEAPLYWENSNGRWTAMTLHGLRPLEPAAPVGHVSFYEAEAFAAWAGARLPTEAEWEHASAFADPSGHFLGSGRIDGEAAPVGEGLRQMWGDLWEWTRTAYAPYPGFRPAPGAIGEYNGKFMSGQFVLRGGACVTPAGHVRPSYRNFYYPHQRWMFSGVRLAKDGEGAGASDFLDDVLEGLSQSQKSLSPKYFYDAEGSRLFEAICELDAYYLTRTELELLRSAAAEIAALIPEGATLVEFGSGASLKTRLLLDAAPQLAAYAPIDISRKALAEAAKAIRRDYPDLEVIPLAEDFTAAIRLPEQLAGRPTFGFFPGSTLGNFAPAEAETLLGHARTLLGDGGQFLVGVDLAKSEAELIAAYDDELGVTAAFNKNLLVRMNRELGANFDVDAFAHHARWNAADSRIEMHLESLRDQQVSIAGRTFHFAPGETLHTENSHKFTPEGLDRLAARAGWRSRRWWVNAHPAFALSLLQS